MLWPLLEAHRRDNREEFRLLGDKAYSHNSTRARLRTMRVKHLSFATLVGSLRS